MFKRTITVSIVVFLICVSGFAQETYNKPPQPILDGLNAPQPPAISVNPSRDTVLLADQLRYPPISDLAQPMLRLAGSRINPNTNGPHRGAYYVSLTLKKNAVGTNTKLPLPAK